MSRFTLTIDLPDDYDESAAAEFPNDVALEVLNGVFHAHSTGDDEPTDLHRGFPEP